MSTGSLPIANAIASNARVTLERHGFTLEHTPDENGPGVFQATVSDPDAHALVAVELVKETHVWGVYVDDGGGALNVAQARVFAQHIETAVTVCEALNRPIPPTEGRNTMLISSGWSSVENDLAKGYPMYLGRYTGNSGQLLYVNANTWRNSWSKKGDTYEFSIGRNQKPTVYEYIGAWELVTFNADGSILIVEVD